MRRIIFLLVGIGLATGNALAQLTVQIRTPRSDFLVYESIPVTVNIQNFSGHPIQLEDTGETRWLKLLVTTGNNIVSSTRTITASEPVIIAPGKAISQTIDLLPLFALRERGTYQVQANVSGPAGTASSVPLQFTLMNGREIWTQTVGLAAGTNDYRTYALVTRREGNEQALFVSVREEPSRTMYSLVSLGVFLPMEPPQTKLDKNGYLYVLFQNAPRSFGYVQIDAAAKASGWAAYSDFATRPELVEKDGMVSVIGGEQTYPKSEHILTTEELNPATAPVQPPPKKKWWQSSAP